MLYFLLVLYTLGGSQRSLDVLCLDKNCQGSVRLHDPGSCSSFKQLTLHDQVHLQCLEKKADDKFRAVSLVHTFEGVKQ